MNPARLRRDGPSVVSVVSTDISYDLKPLTDLLRGDRKDQKVLNPLIIGEMRFAIPPLRSCSANCKAVLSSNNVSPPKIAPTNTPSGFSTCRICVKAPRVRTSWASLVWTDAPTISPTQCNPLVEMTASSFSRRGMI